MITNMYSIVKYVGDGANNSFSIPFQYITQNDLKVYIDGVLTTSYTITGTNTLVTNQPIQKGSILTIKRETIRDRLVDFQDGSLLHEASLDLDSIQMLYLVQEMVDMVESAPRLGEDNRYDMKGKVLKNVGEPINPTDGATKGYLDDIKAQITAIQQAIDDDVFRMDELTEDAVQAATLASQHEEGALAWRNEADQAAALASDRALNAKTSSDSAAQSASEAYAHYQGAEQAYINASQSAYQADVKAQEAAASADLAATYTNHIDGGNASATNPNP